MAYKAFEVEGATKRRDKSRKVLSKTEKIKHQFNVLKKIFRHRLKCRNVRDDELLNVVDELLSHHYDEKLLSQFNEAAPSTAL